MKLFSRLRFSLVLALVVLLAAMAAVTRLRLPAARLDTVELNLQPAPAASERGRHLDQALLANLAAVQGDQVLTEALAAPRRRVHLRRFWIDTCEVSQGDFEGFLRWRKQHPGVQIAASGEPGSWTYGSISRGHRIAGRLQSPASGTAYYDAYSYCRAAGGRLPYAEEWQAAAGGAQGRLYPWGDIPQTKPWPYIEPLLNAGQVCGLHPSTDTPEGIHDMAGGVEEWSQGTLAALPGDPRPSPMLHGAPANRGPARAIYALNGLQRSASPEHRSHQTGFRCIYMRPPSPQLPWGGLPRRAALPAGDYPVGLPEDARLPRFIEVLPAGQLARISALFKGDGGSRHIRMGRCEVSRAHYRIFLRDPLVRFGLFANDSEPAGASYLPLDWAVQRQRPELPVSGVNWWAADAFARWAGGRLPAAYEWYAAASGGGSRSYPWGEIYALEHAQSADRPDAVPAVCGSLPGDRSAEGVLDLAGNLSEWTRSLAVTGGRYFVLARGGSYLLPGKDTARNAFSRALPLDHRAADVGFRVVFD